MRVRLGVYFQGKFLRRRPTDGGEKAFVPVRLNGYTGVLKQGPVGSQGFKTTIGGIQSKAVLALGGFALKIFYLEKEGLHFKLQSRELR
jgi:hypothetical protein